MGAAYGPWMPVMSGLEGVAAERGEAIASCSNAGSSGRAYVEEIRVLGISF
jgi:hypothetical protein